MLSENKHNDRKSKNARRLSREMVPAKPPQKHKDKTKYTRKLKHKK